MTLKEHIDEIGTGLETGQYGNEAAVSQGIVLRLLDALTWPRFNTQVIIPEYSVGGRRVDFALCHPPSKPIIFIEVKQVGNIDGAEQQLFEYAFHEGVPIAILTDGREWRFFHPTAQGDYRERKVCELNLSEGNSEENAKRLKRYLNYESIRTGEAVEAIKADYEKVVQQRQVATRLPEAWNKLVEEADEFLLHAVAEKTESLCGYRPTDEQVLDFLKSLKRKIGPDNGKRRSSRNPGLFVTMPDGEEINHKVSATTFAEVIEKLGIERVRNLNKVYIIPIISTSKHHTYNQRKSGRYYIMTNTDAKTKKRLLEEIASELGESLLKIKIVEKS
jgi:predicted type IV restriction endonuclease